MLILIILLKKPTKAILSGLLGRGVLLKSKQVSKIPVRLTIKKMIEALPKELVVANVEMDDEAVQRLPLEVVDVKRRSS